jgi:hypothetical protein
LLEPAARTVVKLSALGGVVAARLSVIASISEGLSNFEQMLSALTDDADAIKVYVQVTPPTA